MGVVIDLTHDAHVHSTFSDGKHDVETNIGAAHAHGLASIGLVDHVRSDTTWLPDYVAAVRQSGKRAPVAVTCGVEAKILDPTGALDLPASLHGVDEILVADHQVPIGDGCDHPSRIRRFLETGHLEAAEVIGPLLEATARAAERYDAVIIAHLFSVLPKMGLDETAVCDDDIGVLGRRLAAAGARVEISERWQCPSPRVAAILAGEGVELIASTDSHRKETIGIYDYVAVVSRSLA